MWIPGGSIHQWSGYKLTDICCPRCRCICPPSGCEGPSDESSWPVTLLLLNQWQKIAEFMIEILFSGWRDLMFEGIWLNCFSLKLLTPGKNLLERKVSALLLSCQKKMLTIKNIWKGFEELSNIVRLKES